MRRGAVVLGTQPNSKVVSVTRYIVYRCTPGFGMPFYVDAFQSRGAAKAYVAGQGGNTKAQWFKIEVRK